jgi:hypothetical protein
MQKTGEGRQRTHMFAVGGLKGPRPKLGSSVIEEEYEGKK